MRWRLRRQRVLTSVLPLLLAACASIMPPAAPPQGPAQVLAPRAFHEAIDLGGRLSVHYQHNHRDEALHGSFAWSQDAAHTTITLLSPLGQTLAIITVMPGGATLMQAGQPAKSAVDVNTLTTDTLGWPLPVADLRNWLQGFAIDRDGQPFTATPQNTDVITQDGWQIRYANWQSEDPPSAQDRPKRIDLVRNTAQAGEVSIRIVIDTWHTH